MKLLRLLLLTCLTMAPLCAQTMTQVQAELNALHRVQDNIAARVRQGKLLSLHHHLNKRIAETQARLAALEAAQPVVHTDPAHDLIETIVEPVSQPLLMPEPPAFSPAAARKRNQRRLLMALLLGSATAAGAAGTVGAVHGARGKATPWAERSRWRYGNPYAWGARGGARYHKPAAATE